MDRLFGCILGLSLILTSLNPVDSIQCYECQSKIQGQADCADGDRSGLAKYKTNCQEHIQLRSPPAGHAANIASPKVLDRCLKSVKDGATYRGCQSYDPNVGDQCKTAHDTTYCLCLGDFCNSADRQAAAWMISLVSLLFLVNAAN